jgi:Rieske Fe-S protein
MKCPAWKEDFPVAWEDDDLVARRDFTKSLVWISCAAFLANTILLARAATRRVGHLPEAKIATVGEMPVGGAKVFRYPEGSEPRVLVRLSADEFVAYSQNCTHLACPVVYEAQKQQLLCPCHEGSFDARTGAVVSGPPPGALEQIALETRGNEVWAVGVMA